MVLFRLFFTPLDDLARISLNYVQWLPSTGSLLLWHRIPHCYFVPPKLGCWKDSKELRHFIPLNKGNASIFFIEFHNSWGWKVSLVVIWSNPPLLKAGLARAGCPEQCLCFEYFQEWRLHSLFENLFVFSTLAEEKRFFLNASEISCAIITAHWLVSCPPCVFLISGRSLAPSWLYPCFFFTEEHRTEPYTPDVFPGLSKMEESPPPVCLQCTA